MSRFADLSRTFKGDDFQGTGYGDVTRAYDEEVQDVYRFLQALLEPPGFVGKLRNRLRESESWNKAREDDNKIKMDYLEKELAEKTKLIVESKRVISEMDKQMDETEKKLLATENQLEEEKTNLTKAKERITKLQAENQQIPGLQEAVKEYSGMGEEIASISRKLDEKDSLIDDQNREIDRLKRRLEKWENRSENVNIKSKSIQNAVMNEDPATDPRKATTGLTRPKSLKRNDSFTKDSKKTDAKGAARVVLVDSSPSKSCPPIKRPRITIPETLGFSDDSDSKRKSVAKTMQQKQHAGERRAPSLDEAKAHSYASTDQRSAASEKTRRKSSLFLTSFKHDDDDNDDDNDDEPILNHHRKNASSFKPSSGTTSALSSIERRDSIAENEEELEILCSPQIEPKKKLKTARKRKKPGDEEGEQSSSSSLSEPWLNASSKKSSQSSEGNIKGGSGSSSGVSSVGVSSGGVAGGGSGGTDLIDDNNEVFLKGRCVPKGAQKKVDRDSLSSLSNWDPKTGKRQATVTQLFVPERISQQQRAKERLREQEEEDLRKAMQESLKTSQTFESGTTTMTAETAEETEEERPEQTSPDLNETTVDPRLLSTTEGQEGMSETQALNLINDDIIGESPSMVKTTNMRRFSHLGGFATKSHMNRPIKSKSSPSMNKAVNGIATNADPRCDGAVTHPRTTPNDSARAPEVDTLAPNSDSPVILNHVVNVEDQFVTPAKDRSASSSKKSRKQPKDTPNRQLDEWFGESDDSEVSYVQDDGEPVKGNTTRDNTTSVNANGRGNDAFATTSDKKDDMSVTTNKKHETGKNVVASSRPVSTSSSDESAFLTYSQVRREREEERLRRVAHSGVPLSMKTKKAQDDLKMTDCRICGKLYLELGHSVEATNRKIFENCTHGKGKNKELQDGTPEHLWKLDMIERKKVVRNEGDGGGERRPRRKKPLGLKKNTDDNEPD